MRISDWSSDVCSSDLATIANHFLAALLGAEVSSFLDGRWFRYVVAVSFIAMAVWTLIPDKLDDIEDKPPRFGAFLTTTIAFFFVEMGDKTQIATIALGAHVPMACTYCAPVITAVPGVDGGHDLQVWSAAPT